MTTKCILAPGYNACSDKCLLWVSAVPTVSVGKPASQSNIIKLRRVVVERKESYIPTV